MDSEPEPANRNRELSKPKTASKTQIQTANPKSQKNSELRSKAKRGNIEVRPLKTPSKRVATYYPFNLGARPHRWKSKRWNGTISQRSCLVSRLLSLPSSRVGRRSERRGGRCRPAALSRFRPGAPALRVKRGALVLPDAVEQLAIPIDDRLGYRCTRHPKTMHLDLMHLALEVIDEAM